MRGRLRSFAAGSWRWGSRQRVPPEQVREVLPEQRTGSAGSGTIGRVDEPRRAVRIDPAGRVRRAVARACGHELARGKGMWVVTYAACCASSCRSWRRHPGSALFSWAFRLSHACPLLSSTCCRSRSLGRRLRGWKSDQPQGQQQLHYDAKAAVGGRVSRLRARPAAPAVVVHLLLRRGRRRTPQRCSRGVRCRRQPRCLVGTGSSSSVAPEPLQQNPTRWISGLVVEWRGFLGVNA